MQFNQAVTGAARFNIRDLKVGTDGSNEIGTTSGNLILDSAGGTVNITDNADVDGNLNVDGNTQIDGTLAVDGNTTIGNAAGDFTASRVLSHSTKRLLPPTSRRTTSRSALMVLPKSPPQQET